ncbi:MAG: hypothetical protein D3910_09480 [Candidatus Electrothrix sp. ATG2]|nr:hypothetical protein [Candidatus Electrothrix sp. ATG2]
MEKKLFEFIEKYIDSNKARLRLSDALKFDIWRNHQESHPNQQNVFTSYYNYGNEWSREVQFKKNSMPFVYSIDIQREMISRIVQPVK